MKSRFAVLVQYHEDDGCTDYAVVDTESGITQALTLSQPLAIAISGYLDNLFRVAAFTGQTSGREHKIVDTRDGTTPNFGDKWSKDEAVLDKKYETANPERQKANTSRFDIKQPPKQPDDDEGGDDTAPRVKP